MIYTRDLWRVSTCYSLNYHGVHKRFPVFSKDRTWNSLKVGSFGTFMILWHYNKPSTPPALLRTEVSCWLIPPLRCRSGVLDRDLSPVPPLLRSRWTLFNETRSQRNRHLPPTTLPIYSRDICRIFGRTVIHSYWIIIPSVLKRLVYSITFLSFHTRGAPDQSESSCASFPLHLLRRILDSEFDTWL